MKYLVFPNSTACIILLQIHKNTINLKNQFRLLRLPSHILNPLYLPGAFLLCILGTRHYWQCRISVKCDSDPLPDGLRLRKKIPKSEAHHINQKLLHVVTMINRSENIYQEKLSLGALCYTWINKPFCKKWTFLKASMLVVLCL